MRINHRSSYFHITIYIFCGFKNAQKQLCACALQNKVLFKILQNVQKTTCVGVFLNKVRFASLIKKDSGNGVLL